MQNKADNNKQHLKVMKQANSKFPHWHIITVISSYLFRCNIFMLYKNNDSRKKKALKLSLAKSLQNICTPKRMIIEWFTKAACGNYLRLGLYMWPTGLGRHYWTFFFSRCCVFTKFLHFKWNHWLMQMNCWMKMREKRHHRWDETPVALKCWT